MTGPGRVMNMLCNLRQNANGIRLLIVSEFQEYWKHFTYDIENHPLLTLWVTFNFLKRIVPKIILLFIFIYLLGELFISDSPFAWFSSKIATPHGTELQTAFITGAFTFLGVVVSFWLAGAAWKRQQLERLRSDRAEDFTKVNVQLGDILRTLGTYLKLQSGSIKELKKTKGIDDHTLEYFRENHLRLVNTFRRLEELRLHYSILMNSSSRMLFAHDMHQRCFEIDYELGNINVDLSVLTSAVYNHPLDLLPAYDFVANNRGSLESFQSALTYLSYNVTSFNNIISSKWSILSNVSSVKSYLNDLKILPLLGRIRKSARGELSLEDIEELSKKMEDVMKNSNEDQKDSKQ